ncbi:MAG: MFS transporter [Haloferacaceae archaeon]
MSDSGQSVPASEGYPRLWENWNFLRFFFGRFVSNAGDSLYTVAVLWLVFDLSGSTVLTGVANSLLLLPFLLQAVAGPLVDRFPVKPLLVGSQVVQGAVVLVLPAAALTGNLTVELVLAVVPVLSVTTLVASPVRATLVPRIVADEQLPQGNSALATVTLGLDMIFDALGGVFIAVFGATALFLLDSLTFAIAALLFVAMTIPALNGGSSRPERSTAAAYVADIREGVDVLRGTAFVDMVLTSAAFNFAVGVTLAVLPAFGEQLGGPAVYGLLLGALGVGRLSGSVFASYLDGVAYGRLMAVAYLLSALLWLGAVYAPSPALTVGLFGLAWISAGVDGVLVETLNQKVFPSDVLGRVSSIKGTASTATLPVGSLVGGYVAELLGTTTTMGLAAFGFGFAGVYFALRPSLRGLPATSEAQPEHFGVRDVGDATGGSRSGPE